MHVRLSGLFALAGLAFSTPAAFGQVSVMLPNSFEVGAFAGASYGVDQFRAMGGANVTYAINKWILPYGEYTYFPGIVRNVPGSSSSAPYNYSVALSDFHGGVHIRIPIKEKPIVPYGVIGIGALSHFERKITIPASGGFPPTALTVPGGADFAVNFGGGLRYYVTQRFGFRVEAKAYKPTGAGTYGNTFGKVEGGIFIQLR